MIWGLGGLTLGLGGLIWGLGGLISGSGRGDDNKEMIGKIALCKIISCLPLQGRCLKGNPNFST